MNTHQQQRNQTEISTKSRGYGGTSDRPAYVRNTRINYTTKFNKLVKDYNIRALTFIRNGVGHRDNDFYLCVSGCRGNFYIFYEDLKLWGILWIIHGFRKASKGIKVRFWRGERKWIRKLNGYMENGVLTWEGKNPITKNHKIIQN